MKSIRVYLLFLTPILILGSTLLTAQGIEGKRVVVYRADTPHVSGRVVAYKNNVLELETLNGLTVAIPDSSLREVVVLRDISSNVYSTNAYVLGYWGAGFVFSQSNDNYKHTPVLKSTLTAFGSGLILAWIPAAIGLIADIPARSDRQVFVFNGTAGDSTVRTELATELSMTPTQRRFRLTVNTGFQIPMYGPALFAYAKNSGYNYGEYNDEFLMYSLLRSAHFNYNAFEHIDIGAMFSIFSENTIYIYRNENITTSGQLSQKANAIGYYVTGAWRAPANAKGTVDWSAGIGLGLAHIHYFINENSLLVKNVPAGTLFARINAYSNGALTVGAQADITQTIPVDLPGSSTLGLQPGSVSFGNACIGISFGWSF